MDQRQFRRHKKRIETTFTAGVTTYRGITSDVSEGGIFIRTRYALPHGAITDIEMHLPDGTIARLKGRVKRAIRTQVSALKNGMGIELIEADSNYTKYINAVKSEHGGSAIFEEPESPAKEEKSPEPDFSILSCPNCRVKNKVKTFSMSVIPKCGKCKTPLIKQESAHQIPVYLIVACSNCKAKNKVATAKLSFNPKCGKCGTILSAEDMV